MATTTITGNFTGLHTTMRDALVATGKFTNITDVDDTTFCVKKNDELLYLAFQPYLWRGTAYDDRADGCAVLGMRITASSEWDTIGQAPAGSIKYLHIPMFSEWGNESKYCPLYVGIGAPTTGLIPDLLSRNYEMTYFCDEYGLYANIRNPYDLKGIESQPITCSGALLVLEFIPDAVKEYSDGNSSLIGFSICAPGVNSHVARTAGLISYVRPFIYEGAATHYKSYRPAFKSTGNNKVYFEFPYYYNDPTAGYKSPIVRSSRFFEVEKDNSGLISGDIVSYIDVDGVTVRKFLITEIASGDGSAPLLYAIPYENAKPYTAP